MSPRKQKQKSHGSSRGICCAERYTSPSNTQAPGPIMSSVVVDGFQVVVSGLGKTDVVPGKGGNGASVDNSDGTESTVDADSVDTEVSPAAPVAADTSVGTCGTADSVETGNSVDVEAVGNSVETGTSVNSVGTSDAVCVGTSVETGISGEAVSEDPEYSDVDSVDLVVT